MKHLLLLLLFVSIASSGVAASSPVAECPADRPYQVDLTTEQDELSRFAEILDGEAFTADAMALVGYDRFFTFQEAIYDRHVKVLLGYRTQCFADESELVALYHKNADELLDRAYAMPLTMLDQEPPTVVTLEQARGRAADALLTYLTHYDFMQSEWSRPLAELVREYRQRHVESIRYFRETVELEASNDPSVALFAGRWLDAYVEIKISWATGETVSVHFEVD